MDRRDFLSGAALLGHAGVALASGIADTPEEPQPLLRNQPFYEPFTYGQWIKTLVEEVWLPIFGSIGGTGRCGRLGIARIDEPHSFTHQLHYLDPVFYRGEIIAVCFEFNFDLSCALSHCPCQRRKWHELHFVARTPNTIILSDMPTLPPPKAKCDICRRKTATAFHHESGKFAFYTCSQACQQAGEQQARISRKLIAPDRRGLRT